MYQNQKTDNIFLPVILKKVQNAENQNFKNIISDHPDVIVLDLFSSQKKNYLKIQNPRARLSAEHLDQLFDDWRKDHDPETEGTWIYYPWSNRLLHILDKNEFVKLRTSRNHYKISPQEQQNLSGKTIGIIGLSVGHAVAVSIATERICGKLKLADFDTIELSNLNRLKTGLHQIGLNKSIVTAREIAEIDPFLEIECFQEGINDSNIESFLTEGGKLDILIDECDDLEVKISCREMAKKLHIPVVMETSDRGMLDVERFDLDNNRPILHGFLNGIPQERLKNIQPQDRLPLTLKIVDAMNGSLRGRTSLLEVGQTISTWPQLASAVTLGGGVVTDVCRRILLKQFTDSGRYYVDLEEIIKNKPADINGSTDSSIDLAFNFNEAIQLANSLLPAHKISFTPSEEYIRQIVEAGSRAPSSGNDQPWKWLFKNGRLHLFHDTFRSRSFANYNNMAAYLALGAAYENVVLKSKELGFSLNSRFFPLGLESGLLVVTEFTEEKNGDAETVFAPELAGFINSRSTNRTTAPPTLLKDSDYTLLQSAAESIDGAKLHYMTDRDQILESGRIIGECDLMMMLNTQGHHDFFERNTRWTPEHIANSNDGISIQSLGNVPVQLTALSLIKDKKVADALRKIGGGNMLVESTGHSVGSASCLGILTLPGSTPENFFLSGRSIQRLWLRAEQLGLSLQPLLSPIFLFSRLNSATGLEEDEVEKLIGLEEKFRSITTFDENLSKTFLFKISKAEKTAIQTKRLPLNEILLMVNNEI
ncbi:Rv1355c family protein [Dyadobacter sp. NIV53]|uniref:Rv1355c family protein n=1 Tax=Dyadobacter sp. NIV53 TaxID=2861765 RepID=UPI001C86B159|nr:Rv1355c family protein [Dyadobacter sp. NIV53]